MDEPLVSVIIPAYQAQATLAETLSSVRVQTHANLDIVVVDDGSRDQTMEVASRHAAADPRVRVVGQDNGGVARARNRGVEESRGDLVAFIDADDLWSRDKIERQLRLMRAGGGQVGFVYTLTSMIDDNSRVLFHQSVKPCAGDVVGQICYGNFVGNGSCALTRKELVVEAGGFDPALRDARAQGCEDWKLYARIAERTLFAFVPDYLTGYRQSSSAMSNDLRQMLRSDELVRAQLLDARPEHHAQLKAGRLIFIEWLLKREAAADRLENCRLLIAEWSKARRLTPRSLFGLVRRTVPVLAKRWVQGPSDARGLRPFLPQGGVGPAHPAGSPGSVGGV